MSYIPHYKAGNWNCECQVCGRVFKGSEIRRRWDGMLVCDQDYEEKHPQLSVRGQADIVSVSFSSPEGPDTFQNSEGYWIFDPRTDGDYSPVGRLDAYASPDGFAPTDRFSGNQCYVESTT